MAATWNWSALAEEAQFRQSHSGGKAWAQGEPDAGATLCVTLRGADVMGETALEEQEQPQS